MKIKYPARLSIEILKMDEWHEGNSFTVGNKSHLQDSLVRIKNYYKLENFTWRIVLTVYSRM